jgi:hypothetical protein
MDVNAAGVHTRSFYHYDYVHLIERPEVKSVSPVTGPVAGGTVVTIAGQRFGFNATVMFVSWAAGSATPAGLGECRWQDSPDTFCEDSTIRCGNVAAFRVIFI